jgi:ribosome-binding factor A
MKKKSSINRNDRLNSEFQKEIYDIISRRLKNPLVTEMFSILRVDTSRDLSHAKVFVSIYSTDETKKMNTFNAIEGDAKKIRYELAKVIRARTVPELHFFDDDSMEYGDKMEKLFKSIQKGENSG